MYLRKLIDLLRKARNVEEIDEHREDILILIPKAQLMIGFDQQNYAHQY